MKTEVKKIDTTKRELNIEVGPEVVRNKFEDVFKKVGQEAKVKGFRPGHVPREMLERHYSSFVHEQVLKELVPEIYNQAIDKEGLDVVELPQISEVKLDRERLSFKATVEISPEIPLKDYKGQKINYKKITVAEEDINRNIESLREARKVDKIDDAFARGLGYPGLAELRAAVERQIYLQKENQEHKRIENAIIDSLLEGLDFKVPQTLINRRLQELVKQTKLDLLLKGFPREKLDEEEKKLITELGPEAAKQVRVYLVLSEIAKRENIPLDEDMPRRVMELLFKEAKWQIVS